MTNVALTQPILSGSNVPASSEYFHLQTTVNASQINTPAVVQPGASTRYWIQNNTTNTAPYFAHLQTQELIIDMTGNINIVNSNGGGTPSNSVGLPTVQVTSTIYGGQ